MRRPIPSDAWPDRWKEAYAWEEIELWGTSRRNLGYTYAYQNRYRAIMEALTERLPPRSAVLDVAGASGNFALAIAEMGHRVIWNDIRGEFIDWIKEKREFGEIDFLVGNVFDLAAGYAGQFDAIVATEVIEHVAHPDEFLVALAGMLKPGGAIFMTTPNGRYFRADLPRFSDCADPSVFERVQFKPDSDGHIFLLHPDEFPVLAARAGLAVEYFDLLTNPLTAGHVKLGRLLPYLPRTFVDTVERTSWKLPRVLRERLHTTSIAVLRKAAADTRGDLHDGGR